MYIYTPCTLYSERSILSCSMHSPGHIAQRQFLQITVGFGDYTVEGPIYYMWGFASFWLVLIVNATQLPLGIRTDLSTAPRILQQIHTACNGCYVRCSVLCTTAVPSIVGKYAWGVRRIIVRCVKGVSVVGLSSEQSNSAYVESDSIRPASIAPTEMQLHTCIRIRQWLNANISQKLSGRTECNENVNLSVSQSVTRLHPAKTAERIEVSFGVETLGGPRNIVLDRGHDFSRRGEGKR